jgi:hypothetical protein
LGSVFNDGSPSATEVFSRDLTCCARAFPIAQLALVRLMAGAAVADEVPRTAAGILRRLGCCAEASLVHSSGAQAHNEIRTKDLNGINFLRLDIVRAFTRYDN